MGKWYIAIISPTLDRAKADGWVYRKEEYGANSGFVRINPDHTFVWQIFPQDPVSKQIKGTWRLATDAEMGLQGGAGIVLIRGESATNWIAFNRGATEHDFIEMQSLEARGTQRLGARE